MPVFAIQGYNLPSYWHGSFDNADSDRAIGDLRDAGAGWMSVVPTWYTRTIRSSDIRRTNGTETDAGVVRAIRAARRNGLRVVLKPHVDPDDGNFRGTYAPDDVAAWFADYKRMLLHYARMAQREGVDMLCIGTELASLDRPAHARQWNDIIAAVKTVYTGKLTYAALDESVETIPFWDQLDYIGVDAYVELGDGTALTVAEAMESWLVATTWWEAELNPDGSPMGTFEAFAERLGKPLLMTEVGWRNVDGGTRTPGDWQTGTVRDDAEQAVAYEAFFRAWAGNTGGGSAPWMAGALLWNWEPRTHPLRSPYVDPTGYTPQDKDALAVVRHWLRASPRGRWAYPGTTGRDVLRGSRRDEVLTGLAGTDTLRGGGGDDRLNGGAGRDILDGGGGRDTASYRGATWTVSVDLRLRRWQDTGEGGTDRLLSVENLAGGLGPDRLAGNDGANRITGDRGEDTLLGRGGDDVLIGQSHGDTLTGGGGRDMFILAGPGDDADTITDFAPRQDRVGLLSRLFSDLTPRGTLDPRRFALDRARDGGDRLIFDSARHALLYDADGTGRAAAVRLATLSGVDSLRASDIRILAG